MRKTALGVCVVAVGMMALTAGWLHNFQRKHLLGPPGVRVGQVAIYDDNDNLAAGHSVILPANVLDLQSRPGPISTMELDSLPKDTTFGRRIYGSRSGDFAAQLSVVLMGTDHTSIHQPQYCLYAQDWTITGTERIAIPMARPFYDIPAVKMTATRQLKNGQRISCLYVYWFVSGDKVTSEEGSRLWSMWKTMLKSGELERWAYISYFTTCLPGREPATFERLKKFIQASAPEFQLVKGGPPGAPVAVAAGQ
jgi:hypothetical protein